MAIFEIERNGQRYEVDAPDQNAALRSLADMRQQTMTAGERAHDVGMAATGGINSGLDSLINLVPNLTYRPALRALGYDIPEGRYFSRANTNRETETTAGRYAGAVGNAVGSSILPSAAILNAASRLPTVAAAVPSLAERFLRPVASAPGVATGIDVAASTGAGLAQQGAADAGGGPVAQMAAGLAGGIVPVAAGAALARIPQVGRLLADEVGAGSLGGGRRPNGDAPPRATTPRDEAVAYRVLADNLLRAGVKPDDLHTALSRVNEARTFHSRGTAQDVTALMDVDESLMRLAGSIARQNPEAARIISHFIQGRQTGRTPLGTTAQEMAQRGLPTREEMAPPMTGAQTQETYGSQFGAALKGNVAMGQRERISDMIRRALLIRDAKSHGHLPSAYQTRIRIAAEGKAESDKLYGALRSASEGYNPGSGLQDFVARTRAVIDNPATDKTTAELLERGLSTLYRDGRLVSSIDGLDGAQRAIRAMYESADSNTRRVLGGLRRDLVDTADQITERGIGPTYQAARRSHFDARRLDETYERFLKGSADVDDLLGAYAALRSEAERKVARLARWEHYDNRMAAGKPTDNKANIFKERDFELLGGMIPRANKGGARFSDRPQRVGRYLAAEQQMVEARNVARGGSPTMRNAADDEALGTLQQLAIKDTLDTVQSFMDVVRGSQSLWHVGQRMLILAVDKAFGMRAESSIALARMLATANPEHRTQVITRLATTMERERLQRFNDILDQFQKSVQATTASGAGTLGAVTGAVEPPPPGP